MKKLKKVLFIMLLLIPTLVLASNGEENFPLPMAIGMEAFVTIHMTAFVLVPLSGIFDPDRSKNLLKKLFIGRIIILLIFDFFVTPSIAIVDFLAVFVGAFIIVPICAVMFGKKSGGINQMIQQAATQANALINTNLILKCVKCGNDLQATDKTCPKCGVAIEGDNIQVVEDKSPIVPFDSTYLASEKVLLKNMIKEEIKLQGEDEKNFVTTNLNKKRNILLIIIGLVTLLCSIMFFFNMPLLNCLLIEIVAIIIYTIIYKKLNIVDMISKQAQKNPDSDISQIVSEFKSNKHNGTMPSLLKMGVIAIVCILLPCVIFANPRLIYTRYGDGYKVLRYTRGFVYNEEVTIPSTYKGKNVLAIGENAFKYSKVKKVILPEGLESIKMKAFYGCDELVEITVPSTVYEIRSEAFANCTELVTVNLSEGLTDIRANAFANNTNLVNIELPNTLQYLGASAFENCSSLEEITIPKGVTELNGATFAYNTSLRKVNLHDDIISIHGEVFMGCSSLTSITLPSKITEIRGNTFEYCTSLRTIKIPEGVTRIGGHAFYGCTSLNSVIIPSTVVEIGSSAFRQCYSLYSARVPYGAVVNERAFKESPTTIYRY